MTQTPGGLDRPFLNIPDLIAQHGRYRPEHPAIVCEDRTVSWRDFAANVARIAAALRSRGLRRGERVVVLMENVPEALMAILGIVRAGGCAVPLSTMLSPAQVAGLVGDSGAGLMLASDACADLLADLRGADVVRHPSGWDAFMAQGGADLPPLSFAAEDEFNIIYSSGTTGLPKGIVQTHGAKLHFAVSNAIDLGITDEARTLTTTALYSNGTWIVLLPTLIAGGTLHVMRAFGAEAFVDRVRDAAITHSFMVPAQFLMVLNSPAMDRADFRSIHRLVCAGSPLRRDTKRAVLDRITPKLVELYGFSEGFATMLRPADQARKFDTVGTPVLGYELRVIDDEGRECPPGTPGEIVGYGMGMMIGYNNRPDLTDELIWRDAAGRSFLRSGDIGVLDDDGFLRIVDRKKDMIISGGFNVFPTDVEAILGTHPAVLDVTVIGVPHERWGECCHALIIPRDAAAPFDLDGFVTWANARLSKPQRLGGAELRQDFPRNALGKVLKRVLRDPYWAGQP